MQSNKSDNIPDWVNKVHELDAISNEPANASAPLWEKFEMRLDKQKTRKKNSFFWMAAASILFVILIGSVMYFLQPNGTENIVKLPPLHAPSTTTYTERNSVNENASIDRKEKRESADLKNTITEKASIVIVPKSKEFIATNPVEINKINLSIKPVADSIQLHSILPQLATIQPKKKNKVVHINEIGPSADLYNNSAGNQPKNQERIPGIIIPLSTNN